MLCDPTWTEIFLSEYLFVYGHAFMFNRSKLTFNLMWQHCLSVILVIFILNYEIKYSVFPCCFIALERKWYFILKKINFKVCLKPLNNMNLFGTGEGAKHYPQYWKAHEINRRTKTKNRQSEGRSITCLSLTQLRQTLPLCLEVLLSGTDIFIFCMLLPKYDAIESIITQDGHNINYII